MTQANTSPLPVRSKPPVSPFARALELLGAFDASERWLGQRELAERTGLPASTVARLTQTLLALGYLHLSPTHRKVRLAATVLALGHSVGAEIHVQRSARAQMKAFGEEHLVDVNLCARQRLDLVVLEHCNNPRSGVSQRPRIGARMALASSPMGWALLAILPEPERYYLMERMERRMPQEWPQLQRRCARAIAQLQDVGYCTLGGASDPDVAIVASPVVLETHPPLVLACIGAPSQMPRPRIERVLGPAILGQALAMKEAWSTE